MTDPGVIITTIGGFCPVQAEGTIDGHEFYFRARGERWTIGIGGDPVMAADWHYGEDYQPTDGWEVKFAAGYMTVEEAEAFINKAAGLYRTMFKPPETT